jgi:hypothetical protein
MVLDVCVVMWNIFHMTTSALTSSRSSAPRTRRFRRAVVRALSQHAARWEAHFRTVEATEPMNPIVPAVRPTIW